MMPQSGMCSKRQGYRHAGSCRGRRCLV